jgi:imidazole glycerol phosphate synthase glutamine amidotransferase subunit
MGKSEEALHVSGLGLVKGKVVKFSTNLKVPHMGWNTIQIRKEDPLLKGICSGDYFYFVHSYYVEPENPNVILATTEYGIEFASIIRKGNVWGCQQHPEKSSKKGLQFLKNFVSEVKC